MLTSIGVCIEKKKNWEWYERSRAMPRVCNWVSKWCDFIEIVDKLLIPLGSLRDLNEIETLLKSSCQIFFPLLDFSSSFCI